MARRIAPTTSPTGSDAELEWRYGRLCRELATDEPSASLERIRTERDRLDATRAPIAERLDALSTFAADLAPSIARRALEAPAPSWTNLNTVKGR